MRCRNRTFSRTRSCLSSPACACAKTWLAALFHRGSRWNTTSFPGSVRRCLCTLGATSLQSLAQERGSCTIALLELCDTRMWSRTFLHLLVRQLVRLQLPQRNRAFAHVLHCGVTLHPLHMNEMWPHGAVFQAFPPTPLHVGRLRVEGAAQHVHVPQMPHARMMSW